MKALLLAALFCRKGHAWKKAKERAPGQWFKECRKCTRGQPVRRRAAK